MTEHGIVRGCRSATAPERTYPARVVSTDPWLVCEIGGIRLVFPSARVIDGGPSQDGWLLVSGWVIDELARLGGRTAG